MIQSRINPSVKYKEITGKYIGDIGKELDFYEEYVAKKGTTPISVAVGIKQSAKDLFYHYLYATTENQFQGSLGILEIKQEDYFNVLEKDEDGNDVLVLENFQPLFFSFVNTKYLLKLANPVAEDTGSSVTLAVLEPEPKREANILIEPTITRRPDFETKTKSKETNTSGLLEGIQTVHQDIQPVETKEEAQTYLEEYEKATGSHIWIQERMKNQHYSIVSVPGDGDCFFHVVKEAFASIGLQTTVQKCRDYLANHSSVKKAFERERQIFMEFHAIRTQRQQTEQAIMDRLEEINALLKKHSPTQQGISEADRQRIKAEKTDLLQKKRRNDEEIKEVEENIREIVPHLERENTLEKYRNHIRSSKFWANEWAIETLEKKLQVKFILFPKDGKTIYTVGSLLKPKRYILAAFTGGNHYELIQYNQTRLFLSFNALPYSVKCLGVEYRFPLPDFKSFRCELSKTEDDDEDDDEEEENLTKGGSIHESRVTFHLSVDATPATIPMEQTPRYFELRKKKHRGWERILSDDFILNHPLILDGHKWNSVTHYVLAGHFHSHSAHYINFTAESGSLISTCVDIARKAVKRPGHYTLLKKSKMGAIPITLHDKNVNFTPIPNVLRDSLTEERVQQRRKKALEEKMKNPLIKHLLISTLDARLFQKTPPVRDTLLEAEREKYQMLLGSGY